MNASTLDDLSSIIAAYADQVEALFFIQIGSNDAAHGDPLRQFLDGRNWSGIMVEPVPHVFERLKQSFGRRGGITLENLAITTWNGTVEFFYIAENSDPLPVWCDQLGSLTMASILKEERYVPDIRQRIRTSRVPCLTFESLCQKHGVDTVDLIHIDAEGHDYEIIKTIDFMKWSPGLLIYEHKHLSASDQSSCLSRLRSFGYFTLVTAKDTVCWHLPQQKAEASTFTAHPQA